MGDYTHFIAIDYGIYGCGIAVSTVADRPDIVHAGIFKLEALKGGSQMSDHFVAG